MFEYFTSYICCKDLQCSKLKTLNIEGPFSSCVVEIDTDLQLIGKRINIDS